MKKRKLTSIICCASSALASALVVVAILVSNTFTNTIKTFSPDGMVKVCAENNHKGNHYLANEPTESKSGNAEFWACCDCQEQFLTNPGGTFTECGAYSGPELTSDHIAYIAPIVKYEVEYDLLNTEAASDNPTYILKNGSATFVFNALNSRAFKSNSFSITNATVDNYTIFNYYHSLTLNVSNPVGKVTISVEAFSFCLVAGTKITMGDGTTENIENVKVGDYVKSYDVIKDEFYVTTIKKVYTAFNDTISTITLADGSAVQCTPNHPIYTTDGFKSVDPNFTGGFNEYSSTKLNVGDMVITDHGAFSVVSLETNVGEDVAVYNLSVESNGNELNNTFIANGIVTHNKPG